MRNRIIKVLLLLIVTTLYINDTYAGFIEQRVSVIDKSIDGDIILSGLSSDINSGNLMEVRISGENTTSSYVQLEYKTEWFDNNSMIIDTIMSNWIKYPAYPKTSFAFKAVAPNIKAVDFKVLIRRFDK